MQVKNANGPLERAESAENLERQPKHSAFSWRKSTIDRSLEPQPRYFYEREGFSLAREARNGWAMAKGQPPCHQSKSGRSFSVNLTHGGWHCFGCGASGDMLGYVMLRDRCDFRTAAKTLGMWCEEVTPAERHRIAHREEQRRVRQQEQIAQTEREREKRVALASHLRAAEKLYREAIGEHDVEFMAEMLPRVRQLGEQYYAMCGLGEFEA